VPARSPMPLMVHSRLAGAVFSPLQEKVAHSQAEVVWPLTESRLGAFGNMAIDAGKSGRRIHWGLMYPTVSGC